ncbi:hypothetical protein [Streptomyces sp. WMMC897]|uniref:hypothetical protein n=1 Tax=Streptomyces sp. WMMC897 TaxID=3014782 RepID=UPI003FCD1016
MVQEPGAGHLCRGGVELGCDGGDLCLGAASPGVDGPPGQERDARGLTGCEYRLVLTVEEVAATIGFVQLPQQRLSAGSGSS